MAVHCAYLNENGSKADGNPPRAFFGPVAGAAVRIGNLRPGEWLALGEGVETSASVTVACKFPAWAALSAGGLTQLLLPPEATHVLICADNDATGVGQQAAYDAASRFLTEGRRVRVALPPTTGSDLNTMLLSAKA